MQRATSEGGSGESLVDDRTDDAGLDGRRLHVARRARKMEPPPPKRSRDIATTSSPRSKPSTNSEIEIEHGIEIEIEYRDKIEVENRDSRPQATQTNNSALPLPYRDYNVPMGYRNDQDVLQHARACMARL